MSNQTPMMKQYFKIKENYQDCILFFRLGDFYEMFFEDAKLASKTLDLTLTARAKNSEPIPNHSIAVAINADISERTLLTGYGLNATDILDIINHSATK